MFSPGEPAKLKPLFDVHFGCFVAVDVLSPGTDDVVVCYSAQHKREIQEKYAIDAKRRW